jgi:acyl-CoA thioesterase-1
LITKGAWLRRSLIIIFLAAGLLSGCTRSKTERPSRGDSAQKVSAALPEATDPRPLIVALGDSITAGLGVDPSQSYPAKLQAKLDAGGYGYRVVNAGVSGDTSAQGLNRLSAVRELHPEIVILELGANDGLRGLPVEETRRSLGSIIGRLRQDGVEVVLAGMEVPPNYGVEYSRGFHEIFPSLASEYRVVLIPFFLAGVVGMPELNQDDEIHPNARGYEIVVENVWKVLVPLLS